MKCKECEKLGLYNTAYASPPHPKSDECPSFYDKQGRLHNHDYNQATTHMQCSKGHEWIESASGLCWCGWPEDKR